MHFAYTFRSTCTLCPAQLGDLWRWDPRPRSDYLAAASRFSAALTAYVATGVPLVPRRGGAELPPWDRTHVGVLLELHDALAAMISARRSHDAGRRPRGPRPGRPRWCCSYLAGVSNVLAADRVTVSLTGGVLLAVQPG
jgi:hypothetical protein